MLYRGIEIDAVSLWSRWVEFPNGTDSDAEFSPLVRCPNPEHHTQKRHYQINFKKPLTHCFSNCGISGTYEKAISLIEGCSEKDAIKIILRHASVPIDGKRSRKRKLSTEVSGDPTAQLDADRKKFKAGEFAYLPVVARDYLERRGIDPSSRAKWGIGWDEETQRLVIPAYDERDRLKFLIRRAIGPHQHPKYLYTSGAIKESLLFGACFFQQETIESQGLVLVEGSLDAIRLYQHGARNVAAILGSKVSRRQRLIIEKWRVPRIFLFFDKDRAGISAIESAEKQLVKFPLHIVKYPVGKEDPAELTKQEYDRQMTRTISMREFKKLTRTT